MGKTVDFVNTDGNGRVAEGGENRRIQIDVTKPYAETKIQAYLEKSSRGINASHGQNFHWELAPEWVVMLENIRDNPTKITDIAEKLKTPVDMLSDGQIVAYIAGIERAKQVSKDKRRVSQDEVDYFAEVAKLREGKAPKAPKEPKTPKDTKTPTDK